MALIYHILSRKDWDEAQHRGRYTPQSFIDEGFIHCSTRDQIVKVANAFYRGQPDLVIMCIDADAVADMLKWEAPIHPNPDDAPSTEQTELFPHVYGIIPVKAVTQAVDFPETAGEFALPADLP